MIPLVSIRFSKDQLHGDDLVTTSVLEAPFDLPEAPTKTDLVAEYFRGFGDPTRLGVLRTAIDEQVADG